MAFVLPMPLDFVHAVVKAASDEELCGVLAFNGRFAFAAFDRTLREGVSGDFGGDYSLLRESVGGSGDRVLSNNVFAAYFNGPVFVHCGVDNLFGDVFVADVGD